jgi:hypothetical protein
LDINSFCRVLPGKSPQCVTLGLAATEKHTSLRRGPGLGQIAPGAVSPGQLQVYLSAFGIYPLGSLQQSQSLLIIAAGSGLLGLVDQR